MRLFALIATALLATVSVANAELATLVEVDSGCPATLPVVAVANANFVVLDRSGLSKDCLRAIYIQNGDAGADSDDDDDSK